ncbi:MAG: polysaccharide pyruvyl transferase family protein [Lentisphaeria bacterium]|nr:polysaccharide pyruvyl transferase family protein [Lentisphaeria bacterium]
MKIAILTQPLLENYGGILQNYALQTVLYKKGHNVQTLHIVKRLRWHQKVIFNLYAIYVMFRNLINKLLHKKPFLQQKIISAAAKKLFLCNITEFVERKISCSEPITNIRQLKYYSDFEAYIVGSDQVWRPSYSLDIYTYFLEFLPAENTAIKISYAASFGISDWDFPPAMTRRCKESAARLHAVSVRENSGIDLCRQHLGILAVQVPDPTLLLEAADYEQLFSDKNLSGKNKLVTYILDNSPDKEKLIAETAENLSLEVLPLQKEFAPGIKKLAIEDWLSAIASAEYVITDSFHGTVFSIIFRRQFAAINNMERGQERFTTLLENLHLLDRLIVATDKIPPEAINYQNSEKLLADFRNIGYDFLKNNGL